MSYEKVIINYFIKHNTNVDFFSKVEISHMG